MAKLPVVKVVGKVRSRRLDDRAHNEGARAELVQEVLPVDLNVAPCQLRARGIARHTGQHGRHVLRTDLIPVQSSVQIPARTEKIVSLLNPKHE